MNYFNILNYNCFKVNYHICYNIIKFKLVIIQNYSIFIVKFSLICINIININIIKHDTFVLK